MRTRIEPRLKYTIPMAIALHAVGGFAISKIPQSERQIESKHIQETDSKSNLPVFGFGTALLVAGSALVLEKRRRKDMIAEAKKQRAEGKLKLGKFIVETECLKTPKEKESTKAIPEYKKLLKTFRSLLAEGREVRDALHQTLTDFVYKRDSDGKMTTTLLTKIGKCDQNALLAASLMYDAGFQESTFLIVYKNHLAAVYSDGKHDYDLQSGKERYMGGVKIKADEVVDLYSATTKTFDFPDTKDEYPDKNIQIGKAFHPPQNACKAIGSATMPQIGCVVSQNGQNKQSKNWKLVASPINFYI